MIKPFNVASADITHLSDIQLTQLLKELLHCEAHKHGIVQRAVEVALNIRVGDGGEDGRISWEGSPESTEYLPGPLVMFQNKATRMDPPAHAKEIECNASRGSSRAIKPRVDDLFRSNGCYIVFTTQELNNKQKEARIGAIRKKLVEHKKIYAESCLIRIYDASQIASWVNQFISTIVSVQQWLGRPTERGLKNFNLWSQHESLSVLPFASVDSRQNLIEVLTQKVAEPKSCFRIMGLSGLGKTRTAFQVFKENEHLSCLAIYLDASCATQIDALLADWIALGMKAILVVDNCDFRLHERLVKEVRREGSQISLLTLDYDFDQVSPVTICFKLKQMDDKELLTLLNPVYKNQLKDLDRVVAFAQGFPQMAVLLANARLAEDPRIGELTEDDLVEKLLWRRGEEPSIDRLKVLQACSLFDIFGIEREVEDQLIFISNLTSIDVERVFEFVKDYSDRGIIDRRGRYGQVVPKPLAIRLAGQWWNRTREEKQLQLIDDIPPSMIEGFCSQIEKLDFHSNVKKITEKLCGPKGPFGQAEVILSDRGSRLFRAFVIVNPESTSAALDSALANLNRDELLSIEGDTRRNLVWALERLCYHSEIFPEAAWNLLLLAASENEAWSNNATGIFSQLFRVYLSGTSADPDVKFRLLERALGLNRSDIDMIVLEALESAVETRGGSRTVGAEHQGTKAPLEEWKPTLWQQVFDYWQKSFDLLLLLSSRGPEQNAKALSIVGRSIRGFLIQGRVEMMDLVIRKLIAENGKYWPQALENIKNALTYDSEKLRDEAKSALNMWLKLLSPDDGSLPEKLKILIVNPPWEHQPDGNGGYIDISAENAKKLAVEVAKNIHELEPFLDLILTGEQRQAFLFGYQLCRELSSAKRLIDLSLSKLSTREGSNPSFLLGVCRGLFEKEPEEWQQLLDKILLDVNLTYLYPDVIRTGEIKEEHLNILLRLVRDCRILPNQVAVVGFGKAGGGASPQAIADFCTALSQLGGKSSWAALDVFYMYCFSFKECIEVLREPLKGVILSVSLGDEEKGSSTDTHKWSALAEKLLKVRDPGFAIALANQLIATCKSGFDHGDVWHYVKPLLSNLIRDYGDLVWPIFGTSILSSKGMERYWLQQLLERENSFSNKTPSILSLVPVESIINWCVQNPKLGPRFVASSINIFEEDGEGQQPTPIFLALLESFGDDPHVTSSLEANFSTRGWTGSLVPYLQDDKKGLSPLLKHNSDKVRRWVKRVIESIDKQILEETTRDEEGEIGL